MLQIILALAVNILEIWREGVHFDASSTRDLEARGAL